jgi:hypothetical protein
MELATPQIAVLQLLAADLRSVFGGRLQSIVAYADPAEDGLHTLALVDRVSVDDLSACVPLAARWRRTGLDVPLLLTRDEFIRTLDVFPLEYGGIIADHALVAGADPFAGIAVTEADLRRALELQAKSHLIHLREGFLETQGDSRAVGRLIADSAPALRTLLAHLERLDPEAADRARLTPDLVREVTAASQTTIVDPTALLSRYMATIERLWQQVDAWRR